uniref:BatD family protein n=1 Tax=Prevotella sp. TaxID=59823 RepID=UPI0040283F39
MTRRIIHIFVFTLMLAAVALASQAQIVVSVPSHVEAGENFRLSYTINTQDVDEFRAGSIPGGLELIAGPYTSQQSSYRMVNGHTSSSSSITFTYTLYAAKDGSFTIPPAHARINGRMVASRAAKVVVNGRARNSGGAPKMHGEDESRETSMASADSKITANDLFIKVTANKRRVHEQEPILLTYKVYSLVDLTQLEGKMPDLTGFHSQEVPLPQQKSFHLERVNGKTYRAVTWSQYVMYPQMTGNLQIPSITFKGIVVQQNRSVDPFEAFLNGGSGYVEVHRNIVAPGLTVQVDPLPTKPTGFSGGVGKFNISAQLTKKEVKAGDPVTLRVVVGGNGNLKLIKQPEVNFPNDFDKYDAKVTDKTKLTSTGVGGNMIYDFLFVPRNQGTYTIPAVSFTYYDTDLNAYKTIKTQSFKLIVEKGDGNSTSADYDVQKANDIHDIVSGKCEQRQVGNFFFGSTSWWISLLLPLIAFVVLLVIFHKRALDHADAVKMRGKKANKIARKRLKKASKLMFQGKSEAFYDEVLRALWGYVGYKLNIPVEQLNRDNITEKLQGHQVDDATIGKFISALDTCEFERYAPGDASGNMEKTFNSAMTAIEEIEEVMKRNGGRKK